MCNRFPVRNFVGGLLECRQWDFEAYSTIGPAGQDTFREISTSGLAISAQYHRKVICGLVRKSPVSRTADATK